MGKICKNEKNKHDGMGTGKGIAATSVCQICSEALNLLFKLCL